ncbi:titin homolog [Vespa mandarinia]|uniref:titin homolog n=1 Tax=Vespa mandarinia TaxID=7446 RepID=UPI00161C1D20|nr:titin homolog [Vespa mandarinia]
MIAASRKNLLRRISTTVLDRGRKISVDMSALSTSSYKPGIILCLVIFLVPQSTHSAPVYDQDTTQVAEYDGGATGCYYNFQHYQESDRIITNEPCLNCTCHNRMLMCYLRVCPFSKAIGQDCTVEKRPDQCCPVITCPEVPVQLLTSTTNAPATSDSTEIGFRDNYGCKIDDRFYPDGAQLPLDPQNPCELCYCIKNRTTCVIQECTLRVAGCKPAYQPGVCCPVKYNCEYDEELETTVGPISGLIMTTTIAPGATPQCYYEGKFYEDGELIYSTQPCQHCYCFRGDIACAVQDCGTPMKTHGENCTALPPPEGECCPTTYHCEDNGQNESITIPEGIEQTSEINQVQPIVTTPEKVEEPEEQEFEITSEAFPGADNAIPHDHKIKAEQTEESIKAVESTEKSAETTEEKEVTESETMYGSGEVNLPEEHDVELTPVNIPDTEIKPTEETQTIQNQNTEVPILIKETEKPISIEQTETPVPTEKITPIYTEKSEIPLVAENTEKPITIEETKTQVSEEETEIPITLEKSEDSSTKPSEGVQEAIEISITENVPTVSSSLEGLETETETAKKDQKIEQPESTEENVTLEEHQTQAITIEGAMKTEELTEPLISEQDHTESTYELVPSEETTNPQEPGEESGKSTEVIVSTEGVSEKTTETISQYESTTKLFENEEQSSLETKESEIPQEITEKATTLNPEKSPIAEVTESEKPVEISESGKVEPIEITTSLLGVQETEQQYPPAEQKPKSPEPELELKEKLPPLAPKRDDFGSPEVDINQHPFIKEPHETEVDEQIFENIPGYKTEDKESIPEIHIIESNVDIKKPEMHAPESLVTETPEKALTSETASSTITKHEENEIETETKVEKPIEETIPDQKETSTTEITPTALDTKASHTPELHVSTEVQTIQEELEHTEKSIIPEDYVTGTIGPEIHLTEKITTVEELPTKGLTLGEFGETSSEEVSSETSNGNEEIMPGKEQFNEEEGEAEEKLQKPSSEEISTESSISEQESTSIPASEKSVEEGVDTISEISPTEKQPEIPQFEIQPTETTTEEGEVTIKETEQKESIETPKVSPPSETEQKEFMETSEVSKPSVMHTVNEVDVSETKAPEEPEIVKVTESTAVSEEATVVSEIVSEESTTKQTEEISTKEHILETSEITENIISEEVSEQSVIPNNKSTESIEIAEAYTSVPSVIEEEPVVEEKSTEMPSLIEKEHTPTLISKEKSIEESEEEKKSEIIPIKEELTEKTPITETQTTEKSNVKEESEEEKETESSVTGKYTTETSTVEVKGTEIISEQSTEKISEDEEQKIQKPSFEEEKSTESTVGEGKEPIDSFEKKLTEIITEEKTTKISIPEQPETSTMISEGEHDVFEDNIREQSTEQAAVSETFSGQPTVSESTTELFSGTIPPVIESKVPIESHIEEKKQPETETSVTKESSTETPIQQEESTSIESISEKLIPEEQEGVVSTTKITDEINGSTSQPEESSKESTEAAIPAESSMTTKEQEIEEHTEGISEEKSDEEKNHELTSSVGISTEETSSEVPIIKETTEIPEAEEKLHKTTLEIDEEKTTTKSIETHEEQSTITPFKEEISGVKLTSPSLIITGIPSEKPIEYSTEQQLADITEIIPTNEITESAESKPTSSDIPGEGNCLVDGQSYNNNSAIPPANPCQLSCQCISSIIQCELMLCPPPPTHLSNCMPVHASGSSCCPIYTCDSTPTIELEADNHMIEHHTPKYEESEKPEHITSIPKVTEIPSAFSDHTGEGEGQEHVSSYPHTLETVSEHGTEIGKEEEAVEERITINPIESVSEESTITQEHKNLQEVSSKETLSEQSTTESTLSITTQKTVEVTEQEKEIVKFLPSTEESIVEQTTEKVTSVPVAVETETTVLMGESEKIPEGGTEEGVSNEATEQTMSEASISTTAETMSEAPISTTAETMSEASISTTAETISEASISTVSEISNEVTEEQSKESEAFGGIQEVIVSTEHGITSTEEEITQSAETEGQTKIEMETTKEKEQPDKLIEVTSERPTEHYTEQEFTDITKLVTTSEVSSQAPEEAKPTPVEHQTVEPESETTNINISESNTEISTKIDLLITEDQTDISKATTTIKSESVSSYEEITTPTIESNQSTKIQESEILDEEKDKTIEQTTKSVEKSTEISTQQPTDQTDIPMVTEKQSVVHIEETPIPVTSKDTESSISTKTESTEPTVIVDNETPLSSVEEHTEPTISVETQTSTLVSVEEHDESEEIPKKSESAEKQNEEKPVEVTTTEKEISEPSEVEVTEHSISSADSTTPTIEKHVTTTIEEQTIKFEETSTKEPTQEYTTLSISPIYEETIATSTPFNEKTSESIPMEEEQTKEKTLENIEGETVGPNAIIEEQTISSNVPIIHAEEEHQPEEITQKPFKEEATTSTSITEIQPTLAINEKTQQHLDEEISFNIESTSTEKSESVATEVTEQTKQIEEQEPKKEEQVGEGQPIETSEVSEVTETLVTFKEKPVESSIPEEKPTESPTLEEKPTESLTLEEKLTESPTLEEKPTQSPTLEEKPTESLTLEEKPTESSILEEKPTESPTLKEKPTESPILEEKPVESSTLEEEPIESSTPEEKQSDVYITSESSAASESSTPSESFTPSESSTSSESTTSKEKLIESSTSEGQLLETTSQENPIESLTPEEKPIEPLIPIEDHTETEQKTETPISKGETLKPSTYEDEIEKISEQPPLEETQTTVEESVSKIPVIISSTETVQTELIEEQKGGETEEHSVTPIEEEKSETPESTESILIKEQEPTKETTITDHLVSEEKATTVSTIREEEIQSTEAPAPTKEAPSKGEVEFPLAGTEASSEVTIKEQSTTEPISEESITKSEEAEKGKEEITESTLPKEKPVPTSLSSITEEPEEKMTSGPVVTEEQELEILSVKPEKEEETTESSTEGFITKLRPIPTELSITETSEKISGSDHEEGQEEVQSHIGITQPESSSQIPQTDKSEGQLTVGLDEEHLQPVNHTIETSEPILEEHHVTSSVTPQTGVEYPEQTVSGEDNPHFPMHGGSYLNPDEDYDEDDQAIYGPGTCRYGGKVYMSAQQIPRDDPCDFCFCFRSDIICLQQSCPPPIPGCHEEPISGFCCPRYECPVSMATSLNITTTTTTTTTTLPPHFLTHAYKGAAKRSGCQIRGQAYHVGEVITSASGPCLHCTCGGDGNMKCDPRVCSPEPMLRQMIAAATARRRR